MLNGRNARSASDRLSSVTSTPSRCALPPMTTWSGTTVIGTGPARTSSAGRYAVESVTIATLTR